MLIGLLSDTHSYLDDKVFHHFDACDEVWHAGDFGNMDVVEKLRAFKPLRGVYGNIDGPDVRAEMPLDLRFECAGMPGALGLEQAPDLSLGIQQDRKGQSHARRIDAVLLRGGPLR